MAECHITLPNSFKKGDVAEWLQKFKICATANNWDEATQAKKIPMLLDGVAPMTYLEMPNDDKKDIGKIKTALTKEFIPKDVRVHVLHEFECRKQLPGESPHAYLFRLKLLEVVLPQLNEETSGTMLLQHFIAGLLEDKSANESSAAIHHNPLQRNRRLTQCFRCGCRGHMSYSCRTPNCNQCRCFGHVQDRSQGNGRGLVARGSNTNQ